LARFLIGYFYSEVGKDYLHRKITVGDAIDLATLGATDRVAAPAIRTLLETTYSRPCARRDAGGVIRSVAPRPRHSCGVVLRYQWSRYAAKSSTEGVEDT